MTPGPRKDHAAVLAEMIASAYGLDVSEAVRRTLAVVVAAAEDDALERAALALGERLDLEGYIAHEPDTRLTRESAMEIVRSCKPGSVKGDRDGR